MNETNIELQNLPVVIGCGIGGMIVSHALCQAGVRHVLVGDPLKGGIRPGESLDLPASVAMPEVFPTLTRFFHHKGGVTALFGQQSIDLEFQMPEYRYLHRLVEGMGFPLPPSLYQVDRIGFDAALFELLEQHPACLRVPGRVSEIEYDEAGDRIVSLTLPDGSKLTRPSFVFDGSGPARVIGRAAGLELETLSDRHRAVIAHFDSPGEAWWTPRTALLRLYRELHGLRGGVWCIPMCDTISVGVSTPAEGEGAFAGSDDAMMAAALEGMRRAGVEINPSGASAKRQKGARYTYSRYRRSHGANWLLVGSSVLQAWWLASAGLGVILAAAAIAPELVRSATGASRRKAAKRSLERYDTYLAQVCKTHRIFESVMSDPTPPVSPEALRPVYEPLMRGNLVRLAMYSHIARRTRSVELIAPVIRRVVGDWRVGHVRGVESSIELLPPRTASLGGDASIALSA